MTYMTPVHSFIFLQKYIFFINIVQKVKHSYILKLKSISDQIVAFRMGDIYKEIKHE